MSIARDGVGQREIWLKKGYSYKKETRNSDRKTISWADSKGVGAWSLGGSLGGTLCLWGKKDDIREEGDSLVENGWKLRRGDRKNGLIGEHRRWGGKENRRGQKEKVVKDRGLSGTGATLRWPAGVGRLARKDNSRREAHTLLGRKMKRNII